MSELFFTEYLTSFPTLNFNRKFVKGYSSSEILKIEKLYGVNIGQGTELYAFLNNLGRCSGGLLGSDPLVFYKKNFSVRQHILLQSKYFYQISRKNFEFTIAVENEVEYYYLLSEDQLVYFFNINTNEVKSTGKTFNEYLLSVIERYSISADPDSLYATGELIIV